MEKRYPIGQMESGTCAWTPGQESLPVHAEHGVLLLDHYDELASLLKDSFRGAGFSGPVIVVHDDGFLPKDVISLFRWFCRDREEVPLPGSVRTRRGYDPFRRRRYRLTHAGWEPGKARYFNQIEVPDYWEISGNSGSGEVHDLHHLRGRIFYSGPSGHRLVSEVDWLNEKGIVRCTDHYERGGFLYSRTVFNRAGKRFCRSWFDELGRERIVENYVTGDITVNRSGKVQFFKSTTDLAVALIKEIGADGSRIFYNSLSVPLFVTERLKKPENGNVLFWQEKPREDIPGNMQMILEGNSKTEMICVQNRESREKLTALGADPSRLRPFGFLYPYRRENACSRNVLICTNSDQIEQLQEVAEALPDAVFHIAAVTEMSSRLLAFGKYPNVRLYPTASEAMLDELFQKCDYYLDINHGGEIVSSVWRAFQQNQLILGFRKTLHRPRYAAGEHVFIGAEELCRLLKRLMADPQMLQEHLRLQKQAAMEESPEAYQKLFREL